MEKREQPLGINIESLDPGSVELVNYLAVKTAELGRLKQWLEGRAEGQMVNHEARRDRLQQEIEDGIATLEADSPGGENDWVILINERSLMVNMSRKLALTMVLLDSGKEKFEPPEETPPEAEPGTGTLRFGMSP